jgi:CheY-like chemotaxis protein
VGIEGLVGVSPRQELRAAERPSREIRVLLVEDDPDHAYLAQGMLLHSRAGPFRVHHASSAAEALTHAAEGAYHALVIDYFLGDCDGLTLLEQLRTAGTIAPALMLTGLGSEEVAARALRARADDYLPKDDGLTGDILPRAVFAMVERRRLEDELALARDQAARAAAAIATGKTAAHDLASPLSVIVGLADLLLHGEPGLSDAGRTHLTELLNEAVRMGEQLARLNRIAEYAESPSPVGPILDLKRATRADE